MFGLCVGELIHSGTTVSLSEGCRKEASRRMEYRITAGVKDHGQTADRRGGKGKASRAKKEASVQAGWEPREGREPDGFCAQLSLISSQRVGW